MPPDWSARSFDTRAPSWARRRCGLPRGDLSRL